MIDPVKREQAIQDVAWKIYWAVKDLKRDFPELRKSDMESIVMTAAEAVYAMEDSELPKNVLKMR